MFLMPEIQGMAKNSHPLLWWPTGIFFLWQNIYHVYVNHGHVIVLFSMWSSLELDTFELSRRILGESEGERKEMEKML